VLLGSAVIERDRLIGDLAVGRRRTLAGGAGRLRAALAEWADVNRRRVVRCRLAPGDRVVLGGQSLVVD
jgi:hypothetical protein